MADCELVAFPGKAKSYVWKYFGFWKRRGDDGSCYVDKSKVVCRQCRREYAYVGNTTNLAVHLDKSCRADSDHDQKELQNPIDEYKLPEVNMGISLYDGRSQAITNSIADYLIDDLLPVKTVESPAFCKLLAVLEPTYISPKCRDMQENILTRIYRNIADEFRKDIATATQITISFEPWKTMHGEIYGSTKLHYINDEWNLRAAVFQTKKIHDSAELASIEELLMTVCEQFNSQVGAIMAEKFSNIEYHNWLRMTCMGYKIQRGVAAALNTEEISELRAKGRLLLSYLKNTPIATEVFLKQQRCLGHPAEGITISEDNKRWDVTLDLLQNLIDQHTALDMCTSDPALGGHMQELESKLFSDFEMELAEKIVGILRPLKEATLILSSQTHPTSSMIAPTLFKLEKVLSDDESDSLVMKTMKSNIRGILLEMKENPEIETTLKMTAILDPRFKELQFMNLQDKDKTRQLLHIKAIETIIKSPPECALNITKNEMGYPNPKKLKPDPSFAWFDDICPQNDSNPNSNSPDHRVSSEILRYLAETATRDDPLHWWSERQSSYPILARMAKYYLAIPACCISSERIFTLDVDAVDSSRAQLPAEDVDVLIFLNKNRNIFSQCSLLGSYTSF